MLHLKAQSNVLVGFNSFIDIEKLSVRTNLFDIRSNYFNLAELRIN